MASVVDQSKMSYNSIRVHSLWTSLKVNSVAVNQWNEWVCHPEQTLMLLVAWSKVKILSQTCLSHKRFIELTSYAWRDHDKYCDRNLFPVQTVRFPLNLTHWNHRLSFVVVDVDVLAIYSTDEHRIRLPHKLTSTPYCTALNRSSKFSVFDYFHSSITLALEYLALIDLMLNLLSNLLNYQHTIRFVRNLMSWFCFFPKLMEKKKRKFLWLIDFWWINGLRILLKMENFSNQRHSKI